MTDPSNPNYHIATSTPEPQVTPEHPFVPPQRGIDIPCWQVVLTLDDGYQVHCGLPRRMHAPTPHQPPWDEARDT